MGSNSSKEEKENLVENEGVSTRPEIQLVFQELKLVLIGGQGAGKNMIGNSILEKKVFTFWTSTSMRRTSYISKTRTVSGTQIHLTRIPGWKGDLSRSEKTKREIVCCVQSLYRNRPHAVLLALKVNSVLSESNIRTLESLQLWDHTIIVFTHADKLGDHSIEDYIRRVQLQHLIDKCGGRYYVFQKNYSNQINKIKELVFDKISANVNKLLKSKDAEIEKLHNIIKEKNWEIETLRYSRDQNLKWIEKLQHQLDMTSKELKTKVTENVELKKELLMWQENVREWRIHEAQYANVHACVCRKLCQNVRQVDIRSYIPLCDLFSNGPDLHKWGVTLLKILNELSDDQLKTLKDLMHLSKEWKTPRSSIESKDRGDLVNLIIEKWGERQSVLKTRDLMKEIPRNDDTMIELFKPFLEKVGETW